jgi:phosphate transport system substrate-binding protein
MESVFIEVQRSPADIGKNKRRGKKILMGCPKAGIITILILGLLNASAWAQFERNRIYIVGASAAYPFARMVAKQTVKKSKKILPPKIEVSGTGRGLRQLCDGVGYEYPDITVTSRPINISEMLKCQNQRIDLVEVKIGYKAVVLANSQKGQFFEMSPKDIFLAVSREVPDPQDEKKLISNPYRTWSDIDTSLPDHKILVFGPPRTSMIMETFEARGLQAGAREFRSLRDMREKNKRRFQNIVDTVRDDGAYQVVPDDSGATIERLEDHLNAVAIFNFNFFKNNQDRISSFPINGIQPTYESIANGKYQFIYRIYFYVKKDHVGLIWGMEEYLDELTSEDAWGPKGYMTAKGMVAMQEAERQRFRENAKNLKTLKMVE